MIVDHQSHPYLATDHEIAILRLVDATPETVFAAWTEPLQMAQWWGCLFGAAGGAASWAEADPRRGGAWAVVTSDRDGKTRRGGGVYRELDPPRGLAFTHAWEEAGRLGEPRLVLVDFAPTDGRTRLSFSISGFPSAVARDSEIETWHRCLDRLVNYFGESGGLSAEG